MAALNSFFALYSIEQDRKSPGMPNSNVLRIIASSQVPCGRQHISRCAMGPYQSLVQSTDFSGKTYGPEKRDLMRWLPWMRVSRPYTMSAQCAVHPLASPRITRVALSTNDCPLLATTWPITTNHCCQHCIIWSSGRHCATDSRRQRAVQWGKQGPERHSELQ